MNSTRQHTHEMLMKKPLRSLIPIVLAGFVCVLPTLAVSADILYVATYFDASIWRFDTDGTGSLFAGPTIFGPSGLAYDKAGNLYAANSGGSYIEKCAADGTPLGNFGDTSFLNDPAGLVFDTNGNLYVANNVPASGSPSIVKFDPSGNGSIVATNMLDSPQSLAFDAAGDLYVANFYSGNIYKFDRFGNGTVFASGLNEPVAIAIRRTGSAAVSPQLWITTSGTNIVLRWSLPAANYALQSSTNLASTNWLAVSGTPGTNNGDYVLTNGLNGSARFFRLKGN
jgi:hypothetical protein